MIYIAHRGNVNVGWDCTGNTAENKPSYIETAIKYGFHAEIDVWSFSYTDFYLGHDKGQYKVDKKWLLKYKKKLWCHAKERSAFIRLAALGMNTFMHDKEPFAVTTKGYIWEFPNVYNLKNELVAICSDRVLYLQADAKLEALRRRLDERTEMRF